MRSACSPDIFRAKMSELMVTLEFVQAYIDDLLCITKGSLDDHLLKCRQVPIRLQCAGLNVNAKKCSFCATETECLGYVLTRGDIKPQPKIYQQSSCSYCHKTYNSSIISWAWSSTNEISRQDIVKCCPHIHQLGWRVWMHQGYKG